MKKITKVIPGLCIVIAAGSIAAGGVDRKEQRKKEQKAQKENCRIHKPYGLYEKYIKRPLDFGLSSLALVILSPFLLIIALCVRMDVGSPVIFRQKRVGLDNKEFQLLKFRSMKEVRDINGVYLPDDQRVTDLGKFLRNSSIDELPSLVNVWKGEMSIIGPRPLPTRYLERYTDEQKKRHHVRPGLSSPAVLNGRNEQTWELQFDNDVVYTKNVSFQNDLKTVIKTILIVLSHKGATAKDGGSRGEFIGKSNIEELETDEEGSFMKL